MLLQTFSSSAIPIHLLKDILGLLPPADAVSIMMTCKSLLAKVRSMELYWKNHVSNHFLEGRLMENIPSMLSYKINFKTESSKLIIKEDGSTRRSSSHSAHWIQQYLKLHNSSAIIRRLIPHLRQYITAVSLYHDQRERVTGVFVIGPLVLHHVGRYPGDILLFEFRFVLEWFGGAYGYNNLHMMEFRYDRMKRDWNGHAKWNNGEYGLQPDDPVLMSSCSDST